MALACPPIPTELVWRVLPDQRSPAQRLLDAEIDRAIQDEPDPVERLFQDALAVCSEFYDRTAARNNQPSPRCPGCAARALTEQDRTADAMLRVLDGAIRSTRRKLRGNPGQLVIVL
jgi:hypothetical protein